MISILCTLLVLSAIWFFFALWAWYSDVERRLSDLGQPRYPTGDQRDG